MNVKDFPPANAALFLEIVQWTVVAFAIVWVVTRIIGTMHRRAYNLTYAESGRSRKVQPDFLTVDKQKRQDALARGDQYDEALNKRRDTSPSPIGSVRRWAGLGATLSALVGLFFSAVMTLNAVTTTDGVVRNLSNWEALKMLVYQHQVGAIVCGAVIVSNAYTIFQKLQKNGQ